MGDNNDCEANLPASLRSGNVCGVLLQFLVVFDGHPFVTCVCEFNEVGFFRGEYFSGSEELFFFDVVAV